MILYNVTIIIEEGIQEEWLNWMQSHHIQEVMNTGCFVSNRMLRVIDSPNEGVTYCIQYIAETLERYHEYQDKFAAKLQSDFPQQFSNKFVAFRSIMEFIGE